MTSGGDGRSTVPSILRPKFLRQGDPVAVAALSGGLDEDEAPLYERGV